MNKVKDIGEAKKGELFSFWDNDKNEMIFRIICPRCNQYISGSTANKVVLKYAKHSQTAMCKRNCFEDRVQRALPPRTKDYVSPKSNKTKGDEK